MSLGAESMLNGAHDGRVQEIIRVHHVHMLSEPILTVPGHEYGEEFIGEGITEGLDPLQVEGDLSALVSAKELVTKLARRVSAGQVAAVLRESHIRHCLTHLLTPRPSVCLSHSRLSSCQLFS